jgi:hypothetical protein
VKYETKDNAKKVIVKNIETNLLTEYQSVTDCAQALNFTRTTLRSYINNNKIFIYLKKENDILIKEEYSIKYKI